MLRCGREAVVVCEMSRQAVGSELTSLDGVRPRSDLLKSPDCLAQQLFQLSPGESEFDGESETV